MKFGSEFLSVLAGLNGFCTLKLFWGPLKKITLYEGTESSFVQEEFMKIQLLQKNCQLINFFAYYAYYAYA